MSAVAARRTRTARLTRLAAVALLALLAMPRPVPAQTPAKPAPPLALLDRTGKAVRLEALKGRVVLVDFWATWCIPCRQSLPAYDVLLKKYQPQGFEVLAVDVGEPRDRVDAYFKGRQPLIRILLDPQGVAARMFRVQRIPTSVIVDRDGDVRFTVTGFEDGAEADYERMIRELLAEEPSR